MSPAPMLAEPMNPTIPLITNAHANLLLAEFARYQRDYNIWPKRQNDAWVTAACCCDPAPTRRSVARSGAQLADLDLVGCDRLAYPRCSTMVDLLAPHGSGWRQDAQGP